MLRFEFRNASLEGPWSGKFRDLELGMVAEFRLCVAEQVIYSEDGFTVFELRLAFDHWLRESDDAVVGFEFNSVESDEPGLVWFRPQPGGGYRVGSIHQDDVSFEVFSLAEIQQAVQEFIGSVDDWVFQNLGMVVAEHLDLPR
jgi:hypothetical protein